MIDTNAIRQKVIDSAIEGRLVNLDNSYCAISEIKEKMLKNGFITITDIADEDKWCSLPENWTWTCLENITNSEYLNDGDWVLKKDMVDEGPVKLIQLGSIGSCFFKDKEHKKLAKEHFEELNGTQIFPGYMLINRLITDGMKTCIIPKMDGILMTAVDVCWIKPNEEMYNLRYLMYALTSTGIQSLVNQFGHGVTRFRISKLNLIKIPIPYPPRVVQEEIADRIDEIFSILNIIDELQTRYALDNEILKSKLIDAGIQGKLTEQLPEDGTAEELYADIQKEKVSLVKEGKIKKEKVLLNITDEEIPFQIPENWKWVRLGDLCTAVTGSLDANQKTEDGKYPFFTCGQEVYRTTDFAFDCDAVLLGGNNASGDYKMHRYCGKFNAYQRVYVISGQPKETLDYIYWVIKYWLPHLKYNSQGANTRFIKIGQVLGMLIPLPPYAEQVRIVKKLNELLASI